MTISAYTAMFVITYSVTEGTNQENMNIVEMANSESDRAVPSLKLRNITLSRNAKNMTPARNIRIFTPNIK